VEGVSVGFLGFFVLLGLKLSGVIGWSWWWVTAPLWGGFALTLAILVVFGTLIAVTRRVFSLIWEDNDR